MTCLSWATPRVPIRWPRRRISANLASECWRLRSTSARQLGAYLPDHGLGNHLLDNAKAVALNALLIGIHYFTPAKVAQRRPK